MQRNRSKTNRSHRLQARRLMFQALEPRMLLAYPPTISFPDENAAGKISPNLTIFRITGDTNRDGNINTRNASGPTVFELVVDGRGKLSAPGAFEAVEAKLVENFPLPLLSKEDTVLFGDSPDLTPSRLAAEDGPFPFDLNLALDRLLSVGSHKFVFSAKGGAKNKEAGPSPEFTINVDNQVPSPPTNITVTQDQGVFTFRGRSNEPNSTITITGTNLPGGSFNPETDTTKPDGSFEFRSRNNFSEGTYNFRVTVTDLAENVSEAAAITVRSDRTAPLATLADVDSQPPPVPPISTPRNTSVGVLYVNFDDSVSGVDIGDFRLARNGIDVALTGLVVTPVNPQGGAAKYTIDLSSVTVQEGEYVFSLLANGSIADDAGNSFVSGLSVQWTTDTTPPTVDIGDVTPDPRSSAVEAVNIVFSEPVTGVDIKDFSLTRTDASQRKGVTTVKLDGLTVTPSGANYVLNLTSVTAAAGTYVLRLKASGSGIKDTAGNSLVVDATDSWTITAGADTASTPGTPVFSTLYDIFKPIRPDGSRSIKEQELWPWQISFDNTTQTFWFSMEHGTKLGHFDPATGQTDSYDLRYLDSDASRIPLPTIGADDDLNSATNPHGVFFDFESHLTPRVWIVHRNARGPYANIDTGGTRDARLSYFDVAQERFFTYNFGEPGLKSLLKANGVDPGIVDLHAVFVDTRGTVWVTSDQGDRILEFTFREGGNLNSSVATLKVHPVPPELRAMFTPRPEVPTDPNEEPGSHGHHTVFDPHGIKIVVDDRTGQQFLWAIAEGGSGRVALLKPGAGAGGSDQWASWDIDDAFENARGSFLEIDDNETPGDPFDDKIIATLPVEVPAGGSGGSSVATKGVVYLLDPSAALQAGHLRDGQVKISTWLIPATTGQAPRSAINQPYLDRSGEVYFIDRLGGVGRFDVGELQQVGAPTFVSAQSKGTYAETPPIGPITFGPSEIRPRETSLLANSAPIKTSGTATPNSMPASAPPDDRSLTDFLDLYQVSSSQASRGGRGTGPFRGFLNAGGALYSSLTQSEEVGSTVFAETSRRQVAVAKSPHDLPKGAKVGGRMAFQTLRDGSVILTARGDGIINDKQVNLTRLLFGNDPVAFASNRVEGDMSVVVASDRKVHAFGRSTKGDMLVYQYNSTAAWKSTDQLLDPRNWSVKHISLPASAGSLLPSDPTAYVGINGNVWALATTATGHLVMFQAGNPTATDLSVGVAADLLVYSSVGVLEHDNMVYAYGTNQTGVVIEYKFAANNASPTAVPTPVGGIGTTADNRMLQDVEAVLDPVSKVHHVFATDGASRLVHATVMNGAATSVENVTNQVTASNRAFGYFDFERDYGGRIYTDFSVMIGESNTIFVYGTNGRDLVEFKLPTGGLWQAANLTNDIFSTEGRNAGNPGSGDTRVPGNKVFGAPGIYIGPNNERHVLQINADGEVVEYYYDGLPANAQSRTPRFHTNNITLALGNSSASLQATGPITMSGPETIALGRSAKFSLSSSTNIRSYSWTLVDSKNKVVSKGNGSSFTVTPAAAGNYTVKVVLTDFGNKSTPLMRTLSVRSAVLEADGSDPSQSTLYVAGGSGNDKIAIDPGTTAGSVIVKVNNVSQGQFSPSRIVVNGNAGNDTITVSNGVTIPAFLFGNAGNDTLTGGRGSDVLVGGDGNDKLFAGAGPGNNVLIGGKGGDTLTAQGASDILIGGFTSHDANLVALDQLLAQWNSGDSYAARTGQLRQTLLVPKGAGRKVFDDGSLDTLKGGSGNDWFFAQIDGDKRKTKDKILSRAAGELSEDIDV